ncbi:MAG: CPBP family intramembrane metalloprotease [Candidatus Kapabacteria bacterium]|nr:CPBP family intramembrane metalloprotease [Candidatus Kapabacteria bacterium]
MSDEYGAPQYGGQFPFPHTLFGILCTVGVMFLYQFGYGFLSYSLSPQGNSMLTLLAHIGAQIFFFLAPALAVCGLSPLGMNGLLRLVSPRISLVHIIVAIALPVVVQLFASSSVTILYTALPVALAEPLREYSDTLRETMEKLFSAGGVLGVTLAITGGALLPAVAEEILFRGVMQRSLEERLGAPVAITHTAMLFAVIHLNPESLLPLIMFGVGFGILAYTSRSLLPAMLCHFANNLLAVLSGFSPSLRSTDEWMSSSLPPLVAVPLCAASLFVFVMLMRWLLRHSRGIPVPS